MNSEEILRLKETVSELGSRLEHLEAFAKAERDKRMRTAPRGSVKGITLGLIEVPATYKHAECLKSFRETQQQELSAYNPELTDTTLPAPMRILQAGEKVPVYAIWKRAEVSLRTEAFLNLFFGEAAAFQNVRLIGAQGATLVWEQKRHLLMPHMVFLSPQQPTLSGGVPCVRFDPESLGRCRFDIGLMKKEWQAYDVLLCTRDP